MTKRNLIIVIILLAIIDLVAAGWYMSRRIETGDKGQSLFGGRDTTEAIIEADTLVTSSLEDIFDKEQHNTFYHVANTPAVSGDKSTCYTSIKHVKVRWPLKVNGSDELDELNRELISKAFDNAQSRMKDARYVYLNTPSFNKPMGDDYHSQTKAPAIVPVYGNVSQVLVFPYMTSQRLLVMEVDKVEYNGHKTIKDNSFIHYDRIRHRVLSRIDILSADIGKENKLLKLINNKIDNLNRGRGDSNRLQHALNVPAELCCGKNGILFQFRQGSISSDPIEVQVDYADVKPYLTEGFKQLLENNDSCKVYKETLKPEPINSKPAPVAPVADVPKKKSTYNASSNSSGYHKKGGYNGYKNGNGYRKRGRGYGNGYGSGNGYNRRGGDAGNNYNGNNSGSQQQSVKQGYKSQKRYSGAKRRSGRYGQSGKRHWSRRQR